MKIFEKFENFGKKNQIFSWEYTDCSRILKFWRKKWRLFKNYDEEYMKILTSIKIFQEYEGYKDVWRIYEEYEDLGKVFKLFFFEILENIWRIWIFLKNMTIVNE
jgi:hypothetical protein